MNKIIIEFKFIGESSNEFVKCASSTYIPGNTDSVVDCYDDLANQVNKIKEQRDSAEQFLGRLFPETIRVIDVTSDGEVIDELNGFDETEFINYFRSKMI